MLVAELTELLELQLKNLEIEKQRLGDILDTKTFSVFNEHKEIFIAYETIISWRRKLQQTLEIIKKIESDDFEMDAEERVNVVERILTG